MEYFDYPNFNSIKKILCIKLRHLGDLLLSTPVFSVLKSRIPHASIHTYIFKDAYEIIEGNPYIEHVHIFDREWKQLNVIERHIIEGQLLSRIRKEKYDMIINLTEGDRGALAGFFSGAQIRVGFLPDRKKGFLFKTNTLTHPVTYCPTPRHMVDRNLDALRRIGISPKDHEKNLHFSLKSEIFSKIEVPYILIHPTSERIFKSPPYQFFVSLINLIQKIGYPVVITSGSNNIERQYCSNILRETNNVLNYFDNINIKELGSLINHSQAFLYIFC